MKFHEDKCHSGNYLMGKHKVSLSDLGGRRSNLVSAVERRSA